MLRKSYIPYRIKCIGRAPWTDNFEGLWPPRLPDLGPLDFFVWGYLTSTAYLMHPHTRVNLQTNIQHCVSEISQDALRKVFRNMIWHVNLCESVCGSVVIPWVAWLIEHPVLLFLIQNCILSRQPLRSLGKLPSHNKSDTQQNLLDAIFKRYSVKLEHR